MSTPWCKQLLPSIENNSSLSTRAIPTRVLHTMNSATSNYFWPTWMEMDPELWKCPLWVSLGTFKNTQKVTERFCGAVTVTLQGKFRSGAALMPDDGLPYRTLFPGCGPQANSLLSQHSGSLVAISPGNSSYVSMTAQHYFCVLCYLTLRGRD